MNPLYKQKDEIKSPFFEEKISNLGKEYLKLILEKKKMIFFENFYSNFSKETLIFKTKFLSISKHPSTFLMINSDDKSSKKNSLENKKRYKKSIIIITLLSTMIMVNTF